MTKCKECGKPARYKIYKTYPDGKKWIDVCEECEKEIGDENLKRYETLLHK